MKQAYVPDIPGKERRKSASSKEGKLGVEGMRPQILLAALERAGATFDDGEPTAHQNPSITKADLYAKGLSGKSGSSQARKELLQRLGLPERLTADGLLDVLNAVMSREEFYAL